MATQAIRRETLVRSRTRGVHHLALCTDDMKATTEFYVRVLGMPLVHAMRVPKGLGVGPDNRGNPPYEELRHYFFDMGNDSLLAFFEIPEGSEPRGNRNAIGAMQHCAFVVTPDKFRAIEASLKREGLPYLGPVRQLPGMDGIYVIDPNGIRLEFACQPDDGEEPGVVECVTQTKEEAASELRGLPGVDEAWLREMTAALPG